MHSVGSPLPVAVTGDAHALSPEARAKIKALGRPSQWRFLRVAMVNWLVIALIIASSLYLHNIFVYLLAVILISTRQNVMALLVHEQVHRSGLRGTCGDYIVNALIGFWLLITVEGYRKIHLAHHGNYFTEKDPDFIRKQGIEWEFPQPGHLFLQTLLKDISGLSVLKFLRGKNTKEMPPANKAGKKPLGCRGLFRLGFYLTLTVVLTLTSAWTLFLLYWIVPLFTVTQLIVRWGALCEHRYNLIHPSLAESTPLIVLSWWEKLLLPNLNFNYHIYHHFYPYISMADLPKVHAIFEGEGLVDKRCVFRGYIHYLKYLFWPEKAMP